MTSACSITPSRASVTSPRSPGPGADQKEFSAFFLKTIHVPIDFLPTASRPFAGIGLTLGTSFRGCQSFALKNLRSQA